MMGMVEFKLGEGPGRKEVHRKIGLAQEALGDLRAIFDEKVHEYLLEHEEDLFATEGAHADEPWADYSNEPKYALFKFSIVGHLDVLRWEKGGEYERLYPSLTNRRHPKHVWESTSHGFVFGTKVSYAERLAEGGTGPFGEDYPGRPAILLNREQKRDVVREVQRGVQEEFGRDALRAARTSV